jgi:hypothetical protein
LQLQFGPISLGTRDIISADRFPATPISPKNFDLVIGLVVTNSSDLALLAYGWHAVGMLYFLLIIRF